MFLDESLTGWRKYVNAGIGRYRLAAAFNVASLQLIRFHCYSWAVFLLKRACFIHAKYQSSLIYAQGLKLRIELTLPVTSVKAWCQKRNKPLTIVVKKNELKVKQPVFIGQQVSSTGIQSGMVMLPDVYLAELEGVTIFGGTELMVSRDQYALYDELVFARERHYGNKTKIVVENIHNKKIVVNFLKSQKRYAEPVIHFCKTHSHNYFHWLIECLPRMWIIQQFSELQSLPLLIDQGLLPQQLEALNLLNINRHPIIELEANTGYQCSKVFYPSQLSVIHNNYYLPIHSDDIFYSPLAIRYVRDFFRNKVNANNLTASKKLFVVRRSTVRTLINSDQIFEFLSSVGFEAVFPERMSFIEQVFLFAQAKIIVGQSGAGMANIIFAPKKTKTLILMSDSLRSNYCMFSRLADLCELESHVVLGRSTVESAKEVPNDFMVDIELLKGYFYDARID